MASKFLLVGLAPDGENNKVIQPANLAELNKIYGRVFQQRSTLSANATSINLVFDTLKLPLNLVNSKPSRLFSPYVQNGQMFFGALGGSASVTLDLNYEPYLGKADLLVAASRFQSITGEMPYVCRVGASSATLNVSGWSFEAIRPGAKYNLISITFEPSSITISGLAPEFTSRTYFATGLYGSERIIKELERDLRLGIIPVSLKTVGDLDTTGTFSFSGGGNGSFTDADVKKFLENAFIPAEVSHVVFLRAVNNEIVNHIADFLAEGSPQPRVFMLNAPPWVGTAQSWALQNMTSVPNRLDNIICTLGDIEVSYDDNLISRFSVEGAAIGLAAVGNKNITNIPIVAESFSPTLTKTELESIKGFGWIPLVRYIRNDIAIYQGVTSANSRSFLYANKSAELAALAHRFCLNFIGETMPPGNKAALAEDLKNLLSSQVGFIDLKNVSIEVIDSNMFVEIVAEIPGEILEISFVVRNR